MLGHVLAEGGRWARGQLPVGWDFLCFQAAGKLVASGRAAELYDRARLNEVAHGLVSGDYAAFDYLNPPHFAGFMAAVSALSHPTAFALFSAFNLAALALSLRLLGVRGSAGFVYALSAYPVVIGLFAGQNCFLSLLLGVLAAVSSLSGSGFKAGCAVGALAYKPQLALGFLVFFALDARLRARALLGFGCSAGAFLASNFVISRDAARAYLELVPSLLGQEAPFRLDTMFTAHAFYELLLPGQERTARALFVLTGVAALLGYARFVKLEPRLEARLAGAVWLSLAAAPHLFAYDWTLLLVPLVLLRRMLADGPWVALAGLLLLASYVSPPLVNAMTEALGFGVQLAHPVLFGAAWYAATELRSQRVPCCPIRQAHCGGEETM